MRICLDLDGVICQLKRESESYRDLLPVPGAVEKIRCLRAAGHYIIISTARHMKTCQGNVGMVLARIGQDTLEWLQRYGIEYDEIHFGKPWAQVYLDDNTVRFSGWETIAGDGSGLPQSQEDAATRPESPVLNIVVPMAGAGSRFVAAGFDLPKPLIPVFGEPMYAWAVKSLPVDAAHCLIFICLQDHLTHFPLEDDIRGRYPGVEVHVLGLDRLTEGQAHTVLAAEALVDSEEPLLIFNADTYVPERFILPAQDRRVDGIIQTFQSTNPRYSFVRVDASGGVVEVAEKKAISDRATTGMYFFARGSDFVHFTHRFMAAGRRVNGEAYVMLTYDEMLEDGKRLEEAPVGRPWVLGTPEELSVFASRYGK